MQIGNHHLGNNFSNNIKGLNRREGRNDKKETDDCESRAGRHLEAIEDHQDHSHTWLQTPFTTTGHMECPINVTLQLPRAPGLKWRRTRWEQESKALTDQTGRQEQKMTGSEVRGWNHRITMTDVKSGSHIFIVDMFSRRDTRRLICNSSARWKEEEGRKERKKMELSNLCLHINVAHFQTATSENAHKKIALVAMETTHSSPSGVSQVCCCGQCCVIAHQHKRHSGTRGGEGRRGGGGKGEFHRLTTINRQNDNHFYRSCLFK